MSDPRLGVGSSSNQTSFTTDQWLRKVSLVVSGGSDFSGGGPAGDISTSPGEDLAQFRFTFYIRAADASTPRTAMIRVYNLSDKKRAAIIKEYSRVTLSAGYKTGKFGVIFDGFIKQFRRGREENIDTYLDIFAADGDLAHIGATLGVTIPANATPQQQIDEINKAVSSFGVAQGDQNGLTGGVLPRGKVMYGGFVGQMRTFANNNDVGWLIQDGKLTIVPNKGYLPGEVVVLTSRTGMIRVPEATDQGIMVRCLLNPSIRVFGRVRIDNKSINQTIYQGQSASGPNPDSQTFPGWADLPQRFANVTYDGVYRVLVVEHEGDTRGNAWYTTLVLLAMDPSTTGGAQTTDLNTTPPPGL